MKVFLYAIWAQVLCNAYIAWQSSKLLSCKPLARRITLIAIAVEFALYLTGYFCRKILSDSLFDIIVVVCNAWYIASIYLSMGLILMQAIRLSDRLWKWYPARIRAGLPRIRVASLALLLFAVIALMFKGYYNANYPAVKHIDIQLAKHIAGRDSLTIAVMSDLHFGERIGRENAKRYVDLCNAQHPDIVVLPGDLIDYESHFAIREHIEDELRRLEAPLGVYITPGNHEYRANRLAKLQWLRQTGGIVLIDSVAMPTPDFYIVGRDDAINKRRAALSVIMRNLDRTKPIILLDHQPTRLSEEVMNGVDLAIHGHTHNGQIWPNSLVLSLYYELSYGYGRKGDTQFYVTSGTGFAGPPFRIGTRSEIAVIHIRFGKK
ncbi:MAG: metallophosphoesterase [Tannerella sp.]|jgi:predicted MPP superfamily phosphohydrolase|nr:metallophosphoesterase [Tannerella sp.]